jgi:hypothetical protein
MLKLGPEKALRGPSVPSVATVPATAGCEKQDFSSSTARIIPPPGCRIVLISKSCPAQSQIAN